MIKLSHMSVKDYLLSRYHVGAAGFGIDEKLSHSHIAKTCLAYLLQFENLYMLNWNTIDKYPLALYAEKYWARHVCYGVEEGTDVQQEKLITTLFRPWHTAAFISWVYMHDIDVQWERAEKFDIPSTFYY